jgi:hypothetical protein
MEIAVDALDRSAFIVATVALSDIPTYVTIVIVARIPITTMTTNNSTIVKPDFFDLKIYFINIIDHLLNYHT